MVIGHDLKAFIVKKFWPEIPVVPLFDKYYVHMLALRLGQKFEKKFAIKIFCQLHRFYLIFPSKCLAGWASSNRQMGRAIGI